MKFTKNTLTELEKTVQNLGLKVRYEKGQFHSGFCILHNEKIVVVNKFFSLDGKINSLVEVLIDLQNNNVELDEKTKKLIETFKQTKLNL